MFSAFNPSKCAHTHLEQWAADVAAPREELGVRCLAQSSNLGRGQFLPERRFKPTTLGYKSNALSIRPRLPLSKRRQQQRNWRQKKPQVAPEPAESPQGPPVATGSQRRGKLRILEYLRQHLLGPHPAPARSPQGAPQCLLKIHPCAPNLYREKLYQNLRSLSN